MSKLSYSYFFPFKNVKLQESGSFILLRVSKTLSMKTELTTMMGLGTLEILYYHMSSTNLSKNHKTD